MKECPSCHYIDPPNWRHPPHYPDFDYVRFDEFSELLPDLAKGMQPQDVREDDIHVYRRTKTGKYVYRIWKPIWNAFGPGGWTQFRKTKMYDAAGRLNKANWKLVLGNMGRLGSYRRTQRGSLEKFLDPNPNGKVTA
jgi:hypothetical protein